MTKARFLLFTWQPTKLIIKGVTCDKSPHAGTLELDKSRNAFVWNLTAGFQLSHDRDWEILEVRPLNGTLTLSIKKYDGTALVIGTYAEGVVNRTTMRINAKEVLYFADSNEFELIVREYESSRRGD